MQRKNRRTKYALLLVGGVITLLILSCFLGLTIKQDKMIRHSVYLSAERLFESIVLTRRWNARYNGVFVLKTAGVTSNPYLEHPDMLATSGLTYTLKNPALMTREISELAKEQGNFHYHITSLNLMNPHNAPDAWERQSLEGFDDGLTENTQIADMQGKKVYRLMRPLLVEDGCLKCHAKQGYTVGDIRGGISVSLPYDDIARNLASNRITMIALALSIVAVFGFLFYFVIWRLVSNLFVMSRTLELQTAELEELNAKLDQKVLQRTAALQESEIRFRSTFEQAPVGIFHIGLNGTFLRMNQMFCEITGYSHDELKDKAFQDILPGLDCLSRTEDWDALLLGDEESFRTEQRFVKRNQTEIWLNLIISLVQKQNGAPDYFVGIIEDISQRRVLERQLQQAQKMEALGTLAGGIAHDFNNILTPIMGFTEMSLLEMQSDLKHTGYLRKVFDAACRAQELIRQILTFSRQSEHELKPLNVGLIVKEAFKLLRSSLPVTIEMRQEIDQDQCMVMANPTQIHQIMMNLCTNAFHAMTDGSSILTVNLHVLDVGAEDVLLKLVPGRYALLTISDTGCGMDNHVVEHIFEPYFTTKKVGEGTGLGLSIVHGIVDKLGGVISVYSEKGRGSTFRVYLPMTEKPSGLDETGNLEIIGGNERILLVDDEPFITAMETAMLSDLGYAITVENSSSEALRRFSEHPEAFDLVVTDITMPGMNGISMAKEMIALHPGLPVILCTGYSTDITFEIIKESKEFLLLAKPMLRNDLVRAVRKALDSAVAG